jgi:quercetin dioxygenase-like cupin family protein
MKFRIISVALTVALASAAALQLHAATAAAPPSGAAVHELMMRELAGVPGKEVRMATVEYAPGGSSAPHRHDADVFVYVLQGSLRMQVQGAPLVVVKAGEIFHETPDDVHTVSANASETEPAKFLVFMIKDKTAAISSPPAPRPQP